MKRKITNKRLENLILPFMKNLDWANKDLIYRTREIGNNTLIGISLDHLTNKTHIWLNKYNEKRNNYTDLFYNDDFEALLEWVKNSEYAKFIINSKSELYLKELKQIEILN